MKRLSVGDGHGHTRRKGGQSCLPDKTRDKERVDDFL